MSSQSGNNGIPFSSYREVLTNKLTLSLTAILTVISCGYAVSSHMPNNYIKTTGTVVIASDSGGITSINGQISFVTENGQSITDEYSPHFFQLSDEAVGSKKVIYYNPSNPHEIEIPPNTTDKVCITLVALFGPIFFVANIMYGITYFKRRRAQA